MEVQFQTNEGVGKIIVEDENLRLEMNKDAGIYNYLEDKIENGFVKMESFKDKRIPGKFKTEIIPVNQQDAIDLIKSLRRPYTVSSIVSKTKSDLGYNLIEAERLVGRELIKAEHSIREFEDVYEYCVIDDYENIYKELKIDIVQFNRVFIKIITPEERRIILSINFPKRDFNILQLIDWMTYNDIKNFDNQKNYIEGASKINEGIRFKANTILLYRKGARDLPINREDLIEVRDGGYNHNDKRSVFYAASHNFNKPKTQIILDRKRIDYIPQLNLTEKDHLLCNGVMINAKCIANYDDGIGFYENKYAKEPIAYIAGTIGPINIDQNFSNGSNMVFLEYSVDFGINDC